jgi:hypothetical protein
MLVLEPIAFGALLSGVEDDRPGVVTAGVIGILFIGPLVHGYNDHGARGWGGFLLRAGGASIGAAAGGSTGAVVGYLAGFLSDAFLLARDQVADAPGVTPVVDVGSGHASFGLAGSF